MSAPARPSISALLPLIGPREDGDSDIYASLTKSLADTGELLEVLFLCAPSRLDDEEIQALLAEHPGRIRVIELEHSVGGAAVLRAGADHARGELLLTLPWPAEIDLEVLPEMIARIGDGADFVVAVRGAGEVGRSALVQSRLFNRLISRAGDVRVRDVASGTRVMRREVLQEIPLYGDFHRYLPILASRVGFRVEEVDARPAQRARRPSVHAASTYLWRAIDIVTVLFISRFTRTPLRLFGSFGAGLLGIGGLLLLVIGVERLLGTPLGDRPILVLATLLVGLGAQAFTIGLLGELLLFFNAGQFRDYRVARIYGEGGLTGEPEETGGVSRSSGEDPAPGPPPTSPGRTSGTRSPD